MDEEGRRGEEEPQLEGALGNGGKQLMMKLMLTYDVLPSPKNLHQWHNRVLKCLAAALESKRNTTNSLPLRATKSFTALTFIQEGQKKPNHPPTKQEAGQLAMAQDWKMLVDIGQQLIFPPEIAATNVRPDLVLWSPSLKSVYITELTVPWENSTEEAYEHKKLHYTELAADAQQRG
ncbi:hypothetical protein SRHO_G00237850 [Serrasalmus rhombeus]